MGYPYVVEGGQTPMIIGQPDGGDGMKGGGVFVILLFLIVIAVIAIPLFNRREPVVERGSGLAELLPAFMVMQSTATRQTVDVNSHNTDMNYNPGPSNFQLYQQGVSTNDNVFVQACQTRELIREDGQSTRDLINNNTIQNLRDTIGFQNAALIQKDNQLVVSQLFSAQAAQLTNVYNSLQQQINAFAATTPKDPIPAYCVSPYGPYRNGCERSC